MRLLKVVAKVGLKDVVMQVEKVDKQVPLEAYLKVVPEQSRGNLWL